MVTNQYTTILTHSIFLFNKSHIQKLMLLFVQNHNIKPLIFAFWLAWFLFLYFIFAFCIYLTDFVVSFLMSSIFLCVNNSAGKAQPRTLRVLKILSHFWLTLPACLFYVGTSCLCFFVISLSAPLLSSWAPPTPVRFL